MYFRAFRGPEISSVFFDQNDCVRQSLTYGTTELTCEMAMERTVLIRQAGIGM